jgi:hypothetical protein
MSRLPGLHLASISVAAGAADASSGAMAARSAKKVDVNFILMALDD